MTYAAEVGRTIRLAITNWGGTVRLTMLIWAATLATAFISERRLPLIMW